MMRKMLIATVSGLIFAAPASAQDTEKKWSLSTSAGTTTISGETDQPFVSLGLTRFFGPSYVRLTGTYVDSGGDTRAASIVPASTRQLTLGGGTLVGALSIDGFLSLGDRDFDTRTFATRTGRTIMLDSGGSSLGAGLALTYEIPLGDDAVIAPFVAGDYSRISIARAVLLGNGDSIGEESSEDGFTGSAGANATWLFGPDKRHSVSLYGGVLASSNNSSYNGTNAQRATALGIGDQPGLSDEWFEYGASASFGLSDAASVDIGVVRTAGFLGPEATSFTGRLRFGF